MANRTENTNGLLTSQPERQDKVLDNQIERLSVIEARLRSLTVYNDAWQINNANSEGVIPFRIESTPEYGRYMVAARDVKAGEVIFREPPVVITPKAGAGPTCLSCFRTLPVEYSGCPGCGAPLCETSCNGKWHTSSECQSLTALSLKDPYKCALSQCDPNQNCYTNYNLNSLESQNGDISTNNSHSKSSDEGEKLTLKMVKLLNTLLTPLRTLLLMEESTELSNMIVSLQSHSENRSKLPIGQFFENQILGPLQTCFKDKISTNLLHFICGIFDTSAFNITLENGSHGRAIMPLAAMLNHSCMANTERFFCKGFLVIRATVDITEGEPITNPYTHTILGNQMRQTYLMKTKLFQCMCPRCCDPRELGSDASSLICRKCGKGLIHPPQDIANDWECDNCQESVSLQTVKMMLRMSNALLTASRGSVTSMRQALKKLCQVLGMQNYIVMEMKMVLVDALIQQREECTSCDDLEEVLQLTGDLLNFTGIVRPGRTRFRGLMLLRQLQASIELLSNEQADIIRLRKAYSILSNENLISQLEECRDILLYDSLFPQVTNLDEKFKMLQEITT
ncbi:unnamed protein product [Meganyctiphanes norvegica]|uniref:SET domain-containing protein n=1 Tax=Meganyctiphanes norvegica TaxID=48144 RepID=A0AAV2RVB3_MEGNR